MEKNKEVIMVTNSGAPVAEFILGRTNTRTAMRLTRNISSAKTLWLLAKMSRCVQQTHK